MDTSRRSILESLNAAIQRNEGVIIMYLAAGREEEHAFLLFPKKILESGHHTYVQGWSAHRPTRTRLFRGRSWPSGQVRQFRLDRIRSVEPRPVRDQSPEGYVKDKIRRKGIVGGIWGIFLDLLVVGFVIAMIYSMFIKLFN
jgi:predicted DNA-binding transcriptional regulator YafY